MLPLNEKKNVYSQTRKNGKILIIKKPEKLT